MMNLLEKRKCKGHLYQEAELDKQHDWRGEACLTEVRKDSNSPETQKKKIFLKGGHHIELPRNQ